jgi:hypothetical protein
MFKWSHTFLWVAAGSLIALACSGDESDDQGTAGAGSGGKASGGSAGATGGASGKAGRGGSSGAGAAARGGSAGREGSEAGHGGSSGDGHGGAGQGGAGAPGGIGGGGAGSGGEGGIVECGQRRPEEILGKACAAGDSCDFGRECCCGECHPYFSCYCRHDGRWECFYTEACNGEGGDCSGGLGGLGGLGGDEEGGVAGAR